jgi:hypothetical protein
LCAGATTVTLKLKMFKNLNLKSLAKYFSIYFVTGLNTVVEYYRLIIPRLRVCVKTPLLTQEGSNNNDKKLNENGLAYYLF